MFDQFVSSIFHSSLFTILNSSDLLYEVKSCVSGDYWLLIQMHDKYNSKFCQLLHRHPGESRYHYHTSTGSPYDAMMEIFSHDDYQVRKNKSRSGQFER